MDYTYDGRDPKKSLLLFSDVIRKDWESNGGRFPLFYDYYGEDNMFTGLKLIDPKEVSDIKGKYKNCKFTLLTPGSYKDTDEIGHRNLSYAAIPDHYSVHDIMSNNKAFYFYEFVKGERNALAAPDRQHIDEVIKAKDGRDWYFIIIRDKSCSMVKSKSRQEGGKWAEHKLASLYGWEESSHDIRMKIMMNDAVIRANREMKSGMIYNILHADENDVFSVEDDPDTFVKYDLIMDDEKRIEVKKINEKQLWDGYKSVPFVLAEQCKVSDRGTLLKIVEWYNTIYSHRKNSRQYIDSLELVNINDIRKMAAEFGLRDTDEPRIFAGANIIQWIRDFYNTKIVQLVNVFNNINQKRWMAGIYGIYFSSEDRMDRRNDFTIMINNNDMKYYWEIVPEWLGFDRLKLFMIISGNAWEYILTEGNKFIKAYKLKDYKDYKEQRENGILNLPDGSVYKYDEISSLWILEGKSQPSARKTWQYSKLRRNMKSWKMKR